MNHPGRARDRVLPLTAVGLLLLCAACGLSEVRVALRALPTDPVPSDVQLMTVVVRVGARQLAREEQPYAEGELTMPEVAWESDMTFYIAGLNDAGMAVAVAEVAPKLADDPQDCCVVGCFCPPVAHTAGRCTCGDTTCRETCNL